MKLILDSFKPIGDYILVQPIEDQVSKTSGGILLPDSVTENKAHVAVIISAGPGLYSANGTNIPYTFPVNPGTKLLLPTKVASAGTKLQFATNDGPMADAYLIRSSEVIGYIIDPEIHRPEMSGVELLLERSEIVSNSN